MHPTAKDALPLSELRILDLSTVVMGPYASQMLADLGADVVKLEAPVGDQTRYYRPQRSTDMSGLFLTLHRNKRSICLDLKSTADRQIFLQLASQFDVVLHNFRPEVAKRLGADYETLKSVNEKIILCTAFGFGSNGPDSAQPAYDDVIQARSGLSGLFNRVQGRPAYVPSMICDKVVGQMIVIGILCAYAQRSSKGHGSQVEVPMFESMVAFNLAENLANATFTPELGKMGWARNVSPMRKPFQTSDGYVCLLPYSDKNWLEFLTLAKRPEVLRDEKFSTLASRALNIDELYLIVEAFALTRTSQELLDFCLQNNIPASPVNDLEDLWNDPHLQAAEMFHETTHPTEGAYKYCRSPFRFDGVTPQVYRHAPGLGEHTAEILREISAGPGNIHHLKKAANHE